MGVRAAGAWGLQSYQLHVPIVLKSGSLKLLEPSGPLQAYTRVDFYVYLVTVESA